MALSASASCFTPVEKAVDNANTDIWCGRVSPDRHERLDEAKVETLRAWGEGLALDPREEVRAAGRAITMLVEEIEHLNVDLWNARVAIADAVLQTRALAENGKLAQSAPLSGLIPRFGA
jgi:hypothetical protein